tara:strand:+ start:50 stop:529 length:480 start_codon:yes stop_codon:yes gene_type:complete
MKKIWKTIEPKNYKNIDQCIKDLKKKYNVSIWIENIVKNKKNKISITKVRVHLYKVKVSSLGFNSPVTLDKIYKKFQKKGFACVPPDIALRARFFYNEQKTGEWLRFATPMKSMIDTDNVPHLPKLGKALDQFFIETYWSYPAAIFHPHNEFIVMKNAI